MPSGSRASSALRLRGSQMQKANMPRSLGSMSSPKAA